jgi:alkanesulfonate monooxygenase SsuD/methylene tetrahydromethanopterin reductase-like flavin-dependent oxidoreductase (luciferase family)
MVRVGISAHDTLMDSDPVRRRSVLAAIADAGLDHVGLGDHISFQDGKGFDGLVSATAALCSHDTLPVIIGVYLLGLRHPMLAARQLSSLSEIAPGRLVLGVGVAGEDRSEVSNSGVDPGTRGRRLDETLDVVRELATGRPVEHHGEFFDLEAALVLPAPEPRIPIVIGGKGDVVVKRVARYGDGWLALFCTPRRFALIRAEIIAAAQAYDRDEPSWFGLNIWCGLDEDVTRAREMLAAKMEEMYKLPFERFSHLSLCGRPQDVAEGLAAYVAAGVGHITVIPAARSTEAGIASVGEVRRLLVGRT